MRFTYETRNQFVEDMAKAILTDHLAWTGSAETMPSSRNCSIEREAIEAWKRGTIEPPSDFTFEHEFAPMFKEAKKLADAKWQAAMLLLGIEAM